MDGEMGANVLDVAGIWDPEGSLLHVWYIVTSRECP